jgi:hypothetical protein
MLYCEKMRKCFETIHIWLYNLKWIINKCIPVKIHSLNCSPYTLNACQCSKTTTTNNSKLFICKTYCPVCLEGDTVWYRMARYGTVPSSGLQDNENEPLQFSIIKNKILPVWPVAWLTRAVRVPGSGTGHTSSQEKNVIRDFSYTAFLI